MVIGTLGKAHIYKTRDIENGPWEAISFDDGRVYLIWGVGRLSIAELENDLSGLKEGTRRVLIENASAPAGDNIMLPAESSQLFKISGKYYFFNIIWVRGGMRKVIMFGSESSATTFVNVKNMKDGELQRRYGFVVNYAK